MERLQRMYTIMENRVTQLGSFTRLQGRLELMLSQIARQKDEMEGAETAAALLTLQDGQYNISEQSISILQSAPTTAEVAKNSEVPKSSKICHMGYFNYYNYFNRFMGAVISTANFPGKYVAVLAVVCMSSPKFSKTIADKYIS